MRSGGIFDYDQRKVRIEELQEQTQDPSFWEDTDRAQETMKKLKHEQALVGQWDQLDELRESIKVYQQFLEEGEQVGEELNSEITKLRSQVEDLEFKNMMTGINFCQIIFS